MSSDGLTMNAVTITGPGAGAVARVPVIEPGHGEVRIRVRYTGMCGEAGQCPQGDDEPRPARLDLPPAHHFSPPR